MDTWMVAVAAGAGYIAQHFKKFNQNGEQITSESSSSFNTSLNNKPNSPKQPPERKWPFKRSAKRDNLKKDDSEGVSSTKVTSTSEIDGVNGVNSGEGSSVFSSSTMFPGFVGSDRVSEGKGTPRSRMLLRNRRAIKPLSSLESCVMAQLHTKNIEMKEYVSSPFASPSSRTIRPFVVTDGSNVINRSSGVTFVGNDALLNVCLGMSFGILYSFMANRREVEKLNRLLKQTESLVQDLEEELEMKDSLIMQELTINDHKSQRTDGDSINDGYNLEQLTDDNNKDSAIKKAKDESFSKIEAELEAELEMLELNMTSSTLERRISDLFEADPEFEPGVAHGELRADMVLNKTNEDDDDETATPCANYAVSPRELSLRLHEVLQWQLEERIRELEAEIKTKNTTTQNHNKYWKDLSSSGDEIENPNHVDEPVVLNLSGEALDAYNEACNEFANFDDDDSDDDESGTPVNVNGRSEDGNNGKDYDEDEMEKMLIKHIVEKARQGSPMVINAQRALFSE